VVIPAKSFQLSMVLNGQWPWVSTSHYLRFTIEVSFPDDAEILEVAEDEEMLQVHIGSDSFEARMGFGQGRESPLFVDGKTGEVRASSSSERSGSVTLELFVPYFSESLVYNPVLFISSAPSFSILLGFVSCLLYVSLH